MVELVERGVVVLYLEQGLECTHGSGLVVVVVDFCVVVVGFWVVVVTGAGSGGGMVASGTSGSVDDVVELVGILWVENLSLMNLPLAISLAFGAGKSSDGMPSSASLMNALQMRAGYVPPVTRMPPTLRMGMLPSGEPIHTAVESCGV